VPPLSSTTTTTTTTITTTTTTTTTTTITKPDIKYRDQEDKKVKESNKRNQRKEKH